MTEVIDSFRQQEQAGRGKAITLFVLTTVGSGFKLIIGGFYFYSLKLIRDLSRNISTQLGSTNDKLSWLNLAMLVDLLVILCGIMMFVGSLLMLNRKKAGLWIYLPAQIVTVLSIVLASLSINKKINTGLLVSWFFVLVIAALFTVLYLSNKRYYDKRNNLDDHFFEAENPQPESKDEFNF